MQLRQPGLTYSACGPFTEKKERKKKVEETGDSRYIFQNELGKAWFQHDTTYLDFTGLSRRTVSHKILPDNAFNIAKNSKNDGYQRGLALIVYKFFDKQSPIYAVKSEIMLNQQLAEELYKPIT